MTPIVTTAASPCGGAETAKNDRRLAFRFSFLSLRL